MAEIVQRESRVKKTLLNARVNLIFYFLTLCLSFFSRKIFLDCLGADFVGLTGTLQNLLGFLNLAELGIGTAIGYLLYKPLFDNNRGQINEIISVMGYLYRWIGFIILGAGIILSCFLPLIFPDSDTGFQLPLIYFAYYAFLFSSLIGYFINYRQNLLGADQKNYVVTAYFQTATIIKTIIQMTLAYYTSSYYMWVIIELTFGIIYSFILNWKINQTYPWLRTEVALGKKLFKKYPEVIKYTKQLFVHKISGYAQFQISPILIYAFVSLSTVACYGNYTILFDKIHNLLNNIFGSASASVGNLIAEGNTTKIIDVFWELMASRFLIFGICIFGLYNFTNPFIILWLGEGYLLPETVLYLLLINFFLSLSRSTIDPFLFGSGMFYDTWAPISEAIIYIIAALIGGYKWGLPGVIFGNTLSLLIIIGIWKPTFLFIKNFRIPVIKYWITWGKFTIISFIALVLSSKLIVLSDLTPIKSWSQLFVRIVVLTTVFSIFYFCTLYAVSKSLRAFINRILLRK